MEWHGHVVRMDVKARKIVYWTAKQEKGEEKKDTDYGGWSINWTCGMLE
jgi:hypothetical protein